MADGGASCCLVQIACGTFRNTKASSARFAREGMIRLAAPHLPWPRLRIHKLSALNGLPADRFRRSPNISADLARSCVPPLVEKRPSARLSKL